MEEVMGGQVVKQLPTFLLDFHQVFRREVVGTSQLASSLNLTLRS
jgi:hypothetical protein